jgi:hypothetical protein
MLLANFIFEPTCPKSPNQVDKAAVPKFNRYLILEDSFGSLFHNPDFQNLFFHTGQPSEARPALRALRFCYKEDQKRSLLSR